MVAFRRFAWAVLGYHLAVTLWGAFVRATGSGAGCGNHWPLCNGVVFPRAPAVATLVELTHRVTSGGALLLVAVLVGWAMRVFPPGHAARRASYLSAGFLVLEALVGAGLVLFGWVAHDTSAARGWVVAVHLVNTFLLLGALTLTAAFADRPQGLALRGNGPLAAAFALALATVLVNGATGAVAALGDTLYRSTSFAQGLAQEMGGGAPLLLRLRLVHPFAALASALVLVATARAALRVEGARPRPLAVALLGLLGAELLAGAASVALLAPIGIQLLHLAVGQLTWIALVLLGAEALGTPRADRSAGSGLRAPGSG